MINFMTRTSEYYTLEMRGVEFVLTKTAIVSGQSLVPVGAVLHGDRVAIDGGCLYLFEGETMVVKTSPIRQ